MEKGYYLETFLKYRARTKVAIHNKNGKGLLLKHISHSEFAHYMSQSTIKMEKGYYHVYALLGLAFVA